MHLFKYMKSAHLEMTLERGTFRIGTLYEYRDIERHGDQIGDDEEGKKDIHLTATVPVTFDLLSDDPRAIHARRVLKGWDELPAGSKITINMQENSAMVEHEESEDVYMYCAAMKYDPAQMHKFGYDACLVIIDPKGFFTELSNCVPDADFLIGASVQYRDRNIDYADTSAAPAAFLKSVSYESQNELRAIWRPHSHPIYPLIIECPRALMYCARSDQT